VKAAALVADQEQLDSNERDASAEKLEQAEQQVQQVLEEMSRLQHHRQLEAQELARQRQISHSLEERMRQIDMKADRRRVAEAAAAASKAAQQPIQHKRRSSPSNSDERAIENLPRGQQPKEETQLPGQAAKSVPEKPLSRMRKAELQDECRLLGVPDQGTVPEMRARLRAARRKTRVE